jgi:outer membrane receptor protein involved in Fe transport
MAPKALIFVVICVFILHAGVNAQASQHQRGEVQLEVKDPSGKALEATGKLENVSTGAARSIRTDAQGKYRFENLLFGRYQLEVSRSGFVAETKLIVVESVEPVTTVIAMGLSNLAFKVDVVGTTPLPGVDLAPAEIPIPVQSGTQRDLDASGSLDLSDFLNRRLNAVNINEIQGNPFQADLNYRGYTASPLLGTPQGLSVYMDGVRLNQPFGDVVSWDLIPRTAIAEMTLIPGSNPIFGLNTLGGSISLQSKDGASFPGSSVQLSGGSFGRRMIDLEHGGSTTKGLNWYLASNLFYEDGWRNDSPSNVRQFFGKLGWQRSRTVLGLTVAYANNSLTGNGLQEQRFLDRDYASIYTKPDVTENRAPFFNLSLRHSFRNDLSFSGNAYYRYIRTKTFNGDINEESLEQALYQPSAAERAALAAAGYTGVPASGATAENTPFPYWRCIANVLLRDEPSEKCNGLINRSRTAQHNYGFAGQLSWTRMINGSRNQATVGGAYDRSNVNFLQSTQLGYLNPDRSVTGLDAFGDGVTGGDADGEPPTPFDTRVDLGGLIHTGSVFATNTLSIGNTWSIMLAGRYNRTSVDNSDRIIPISGGPFGDPRSLTARHNFQRFNPAVGLTFRPIQAVNAYLSYSEGSRAPTSVELGCANPEQPCKLPNAMAGDPPLQQVVTRTLEAGLRGGHEGVLRWSAGWFRAENRNDILFVASNQTGYGYFKNFGKTRRQGFEMEINGRIGRFSPGGGYTFLDATFQSPETVNGAGNSFNDEIDESPGLEGLIQIDPGARIPLSPRHMLKTWVNFQATSKFRLDLGVIAMSGAFARGNENNLHQPDGEYYLGSGRTPGYAVANLGGRYQINRRIELFARVNNLFNRKYYTAALLAPTGFTDNGAFIARPFPAVDGEYPIRSATFYAPGAPLGAWGGVRLSF